MLLGLFLGETYDYRTTTYIIFLNGSPIQWKTKFDRSSINKSSCEAEDIALSNAITNTIAIEYILIELLQDAPLTVQINTDKEAVVKCIW
jgi:hypothetical protein